MLERLACLSLTSLSDNTFRSRCAKYFSRCTRGVLYCRSSHLLLKASHHVQDSLSNVSMQCFSSIINLFCILRPAGVSACLPAPQPKGSTNLRRPLLSTTASASRGNFPPPSGCSKPRRTKWLFGGSTAEIKGSEKVAVVEGLCAKGLWQSTRACSDGATA